MSAILEELETAKRNVSWLLDHGGIGASVSMHGIVYWAGRVEALRDQIRAL